MPVPQVPFLTRLRFALALLPVAVLAAAEIPLTSPDGLLRGTVSADASGALIYTVQREGRVIIAPSRIGVTCDGSDLGVKVTLGEPRLGQVDETFPVLGGKRVGTNRARTLSLPVTPARGPAFTLEARAYDGGFAWRLVVPGAGPHRITGEASSWQLPAGARVWFAERNNDWKLKSYAGEWTACDVDQLPTISSQGPVQGPPLVAELAGGGYALLTEAALYNYSGLRLRAVGNRTLRADFTEGEKGFVVDGPVITPWRVTLMVPSLDALVNSDVIAGLNPAPDPRFFADISYIKPGRCVWRFLTQHTGTPAEETQYVDFAAELGFEYSLVDEGWEKWPNPWADVAKLAAYGRAHRVGIFIWKNSKDLFDPSGDRTALRDFLDHAHAAGVAGVKIDYLNGETKALVDYEVAALTLAAERRLMVDFHGIFKPTGEARTYPNEISREGIRGLELNNMKEGPVTARHNAALPFTRFVVGHGDYTPLGYSIPGATSWAHQLATVIAFTSPLQVLGESGDMLLHTPATRLALDVLKAIPSVWDETRVLAPSAIGELALLARRSGTSWFVAALNGRKEPTALSALDLSFLGAATYHAVLLTSPSPRAFVRREIAHVDRTTTLPLTLAVGDGAVIWFQPEL